MAKKKDEMDVLVVRDEKTGDLSVVAGLNADGSIRPISKWSGVSFTDQQKADYVAG